MTRPSPRLMSAHASSLCREHGIARGGESPFSKKIMAVIGNLVDQGWADTVNRRLHYPVVISTKSYFVAMHEIGHMLLGHIIMEDDPLWRVLAIEAEANQWAKDHMLEGSWDAPARRCCHRQLDMNLENMIFLATQCGIPVPTWLPPADHLFWTLYGTSRQTWLEQKEIEDIETEPMSVLGLGERIYEIRCEEDPTETKIESIEEWRSNWDWVDPILVSDHPTAIISDTTNRPITPFCG